MTDAAHTPPALTAAREAYEAAKERRANNDDWWFWENALATPADDLIAALEADNAAQQARIAELETALPLLGRAWSQLQQVLGGHFPRPEVEVTVEAIGRYYAYGDARWRADDAGTADE